MMHLPTPEDVAAAARRLQGRLVRTPMLRNPLLDQLTGGTILLKPECLQRTGSFKLRGATNAALLLDAAQRRAGVVTHSSGNHGQALACAAAAVGAHATIFMPADAPQVKVDGTRRGGAEIIPFNRNTADRAGLAAAFAARTGAAHLPPFDHPHVIAGQGTLALELAEEAATAGLALDALNPPGGSQLCDALLSNMPGEITFAINRHRLAGGTAVSDAALLANKFQAKGKTVGIVLSGGNVDPAVFNRALAA